MLVIQTITAKTHKGAVRNTQGILLIVGEGVDTGIIFVSHTLIRSFLDGLIKINQSPIIFTF
jgi:hypothetical protein